ncbi:hypothetical protein Q2T40_20465 [Winogradskyella maritima]|uniref:TonB-like protein n=1 Tax=Winogradskyella maritima TaxID=1517766 RepID=A0ABV8ACR5_9FLAO|nr:hypothetical protein [Winogradskyella maritima]
MRLLFLVFFIACFSEVYAQNVKLKYNQADLIFPGCETAEDQKKCFKVKTESYMLSNLTDSLKQKLIKLSQSDTITLSFKLLYDESGELIKKQSNVYSSADSTFKELNVIAYKLPKVAPLRDEYDRGVGASISFIHGWLINRTDNSLNPILDFEPIELPLVMVDKFPHYEVCEPYLNSENETKCLSGIYRQVVQNNFKGDALANGLDLSRGIHAIFLYFKITSEKKIEFISARAPHPMLEREGKRLVTLFPAPKEPGFYKEKPVDVHYILPIKFYVD